MNPAALILMIGLLAWLPLVSAQDESVATGTKEETAAAKNQTPLDKRLEILLVDLSPDWLTALTTRF